MSTQESPDDHEILSTRLLDAPRAKVFRAFRNPGDLAKWWGPKDFTNSFHAFDFRPGGTWHFLMQGPDGTGYENESLFSEIETNTRLVIEHVSLPRFRLTAVLSDEEGKTRLTWNMRFETAEMCSKLKPICIPKNEENFDRLEVVLAEMSPDDRELAFCRVLDAPRENLFRCWTEPGLLTKWFTPPPYETLHAELDVQPGGASLVVMRGPDGIELPNTGIYLDVVPNERIIFTDAFTRAWEPSAKPFMVGRLTFEDHGEGQTKYSVRVLHWSAADREAHEQMGFFLGWGIATDQLAALAATL